MHDEHSRFQSAPPHGERHAARCGVRRTWIRSFNPRPRTGSDFSYLATSVLVLLFQSAPPHGERHALAPEPPTSSCFNPRPRTGSDRFVRRNQRRLQCFNPRPRTGSDRAVRSAISWVTRSFNPRPRTGSDLSAGLTMFQCRLADVSIRAPARGATIPAWRSSGGLCKFQSAPPHGERPTAQVIGPGKCVSIRAPARGATRTAGQGFNPRPRTGSLHQRSPGS